MDDGGHKNFISSIIGRILQFFTRTQKLPFFLFYSYLWKNNKGLLARSFLFNYILPIIIEILPWWASKRKVGNKLRAARIKLNQNMVTALPLQWRLMKDFIQRGLLYAFLDLFTHLVSYHIAEQNNLAVRRLVMERVLYSEVLAFQQMNTVDLDLKVAKDIITGLNFFNEYLPSLLTNLIAFVLEGSHLFKKRSRIDWLAIVYPVVIASLYRIIVWVQQSRYTKKRKKESKFNDRELRTYIWDTMQRLVDIQINNLQEIQLRAYDATGERHLSTKYGLRTFPSRTISKLQQMSIVSYVFEIWCVHQIMKRQSMNFVEFSKLQQEIDHFVIIGRRTLHVIRAAWNLYGSQSKVVMQWATLPTWKEADKDLYSIESINNLTKIDSDNNMEIPKNRNISKNPLDQFNFQSLVVSQVVFSYENPSKKLNMTGYVAPAIEIYNDITFEPGKRYGLVGGRAGTALALLMCKIYTPSSGVITLNGIPYDKISKSSLRQIITHASQDPLICNGTIRENLLLFNPNATEAELFQAILCAGVYLFVGNQEIDDDFSKTGKSRLHRKLKQSSRVTKKKIIKTKKNKDKERGDSYGNILESADIYKNSTTHFSNLITQTENNYSDSFGNMSSSEEDSDPILSSSDSEEFVSEGMLKSVSSPALLLMEERALRGGKKFRSGNVSTWGMYQSLSVTVDDTEQPSEVKLRDILDEKVSRDEVPKALAQAIGLARIFLRPSAKIIILDKAMSEMDEFQLRKTVFPNLFQFIQEHQMCLIAITPSVSLLRELNTIFVFEKGTVVHTGTHKQLVKQQAAKYMEYMFPWKTSMKT